MCVSGVPPPLPELVPPVASLSCFLVGVTNTGGRPTPEFIDLLDSFPMDLLCIKDIVSDFSSLPIESDAGCNIANGRDIILPSSSLLFDGCRSLSGVGGGE